MTSNLAHNLTTEQEILTMKIMLMLTKKMAMATTVMMMTTITKILMKTLKMKTMITTTLTCICTKGETKGHLWPHKD